MKKILYILLLLVSKIALGQDPAPSNVVQLTTNTPYYQTTTGLHWYYNGTTYLWYKGLGVKDSTYYITPYYASQHFAPVGGGVTSFNARTGAVVPLVGDYNSFYIRNNPSTAENKRIYISQSIRTDSAFITGNLITGPSNKVFGGSATNAGIGTIGAHTLQLGTDGTSRFEMDASGIFAYNTLFGTNINLSSALPGGATPLGSTINIGRYLIANQFAFKGSNGWAAGIASTGFTQDNLFKLPNLDSKTLATVDGGQTFSSANMGANIVYRTPTGTAGTDSIKVKIGSTGKDGAIAGNYYQTALGFTPENVANKIATQSSSTITYPNWLGLTNYVGGLSSVYQPLNAKLTAFGALANASGALTNNGSGVFSYTAIPTATDYIVNKNGSTSVQATSKIIVSDTIRTSTALIAPNILAKDSLTVGVYPTPVTSIIGYGNSIMVGNVASPLTLGFITQTSKALNTTLNNQGVNGSDLTNFLNSSFFNAVPTYVITVKYLFLMYGTNDVTNGATVAQYTARVSAAIDSLHTIKGYPLNKIVWLGVPFNTQGTALAQSLLAQFAAVDSTVATQKGVRFVELYHYMKSHGASALLEPSGLHPNNYGHKVIFTRIIEMLNDAGLLGTALVKNNLTINNTTTTGQLIASLANIRGANINSATIDTLAIPYLANINTASIANMVDSLNFGSSGYGIPAGRNTIVLQDDGGIYKTGIGIKSSGLQVYGRGGINFGATQDATTLSQANSAMYIDNFNNLYMNSTAYANNIRLANASPTGNDAVNANYLNTQLATKAATISGIGYSKWSGTTPSFVTAIPNADLANSAITLNGTSTSLGSSFTVTKNNTDTTSTGFATRSLLNNYATKLSPIFITPTLGVATATSYTTTGTAGAGFVGLAPQSSAPSTPVSGVVLYNNNSANRLTVLGANGFTNTFNFNGNSGNVVYTFPTATSTLAPTASPTFTGTVNAATITATGTVQGSQLNINTTATTPVLNFNSTFSPAVGNSAGNFTVTNNGNTARMSAIYNAGNTLDFQWVQYNGAGSSTNMILTSGGVLSLPNYSNGLASFTTGGVISSVTALPSGTTATTQSASDNSTKVATTAYVDAAIGAGLVNPMTTAGDIIIGGASGTPTRLGIGSSAKILGVAVAGGSLEYKTLVSGSGVSVVSSGSNVAFSNSSFAYTSSATSTLTNTTTETSLIPTGAGSMTVGIPSGGTQYRIIIGGIYSTPAITAGTLTIKIKYNGTVIATGVASGFLAGASGLAFDGIAKIVIGTVGASGSMYISGGVNYSVANNAARFTLDLNNGGASTTVNNSTGGLIEVTGTWDTANASKSVTITQFTLEQLK